MKSKIQKQLLCGALVLLGGCMSPQTEAAPNAASPIFVTTGQGRGADLNVRGGATFATGNFGDHDVVRVRNTSNLGDARKTYLRFDLSTLPLSIKKASGVTLGLRLVPAEGKSLPGKVWTFNVFGLKDAARDENWGERDVTWNNAPANDPSSPFRLKAADVTRLGNFTITGAGTAGQSIAFSSPRLLKFLKHDTNGEVTLIIARQEAGEAPDNDVMHIFASKEHATNAPPVLSISFQEKRPALPTAAQWATLPAAPKPTRFESEIAAFEAADRQNPPAKGGIVFVGSSSIRLWNSLAQDFPGLNVINRGFGGSYISESVSVADRIVTPYQPKMIVFYAGTNDLADGKTPETLLADYQAFVARVRVKLPTTPIAFISVAPALSRWSNEKNIRKANDLIEQFSKTDPNLKFINILPLMLDENGQPRPELFVSDRLHMTPAGYAIWKKAVAPFLPKP